MVQKFKVIEDLPSSASDAPPSVNVIKFETPGIVDAFHIAPIMHVAQRMHVWDLLHEGTAPGGLQLTCPSVIGVRSYKREVERPVFLSLLDLRSNGWTTDRDKYVCHILDGTKWICIEGITKRPHYS